MSEVTRKQNRRICPSLPICRGGFEIVSIDRNRSYTSQSVRFKQTLGSLLIEFGYESHPVHFAANGQFLGFDCRDFGCRQFGSATGLHACKIVRSDVVEINETGSRSWQVVET